MGLEVGWRVGAGDGDAVGLGVGAGDGDTVGAAVGEGEGASVGLGVGASVGAPVGPAVGAAVGTAEQVVCPCAPPVHVPGPQPRHCAYAPATWYLPDGQCSQLVRPVHAVYFPVAHAWHVPPAEGWNRPSVQSVHEAEPAAANCPLTHAVHDSALNPGECVPSAHGAQLAVLRKLPGSHAGVGDAVGDGVGVNVGAGVGTAAQAVCPCAPPVHCPAAHSWHTWYAATSWCLPLGQW